MKAEFCSGQTPAPYPPPALAVPAPLSVSVTFHHSGVTCKKNLHFNSVRLSVTGLFHFVASLHCSSVLGHESEFLFQSQMAEYLKMDHIAFVCSTVSRHELLWWFVVTPIWTEMCKYLFGSLFSVLLNIFLVMKLLAIIPSTFCKILRIIYSYYTTCIHFSICMKVPSFLQPTNIYHVLAAGEYLS